MHIYSTRGIEGIPECNSSLKIKDIITYKNHYASLFSIPIIKIIEAFNIYVNENCPGYIYIYIYIYILNIYYIDLDIYIYIYIKYILY